MAKTAPAGRHASSVPAAAPSPTPLARHPGGRPSTYTRELGEAFCERLAAGEFLTDICKEPGFPSHSTVYRWDFEHAEFREAHARARVLQARAFAERGVKETLEATAESANLANVRFRALTWVAGKLDAVWSDKPAAANIQINIGAERVTASKRVLLASLDDLAAGAHLIEGTAEEVEFGG